LVSSTDQDFKEVAENTGKVMYLVEEITGASQEQSQGIDQINKAVAEMSSGTQTNAASAQELAAIMSSFKTETNGCGFNVKRPSGKGGARIKIFSKSPQRILTTLKAREISPDRIIPLEENEL
jgi:uncharacterized phage infection (PIP) family protein YhgE